MSAPRAEKIQRLQQEIEDLFPGGLHPEDSDALAALYAALVTKLHKLQFEEEQFVATMSLTEKTQKGLFLTLLATIGGLFVATLRDLGGLLGLLSGLGGFIIQAILTIWELLGLGINKAQQIKIEQEKTKVGIGVINLGLITVGTLTMLGFISFSVAAAPFVIPAIFAVMIGFNFYKENYILYEVQKEIRQLETDLIPLERTLALRIIEVANKDYQIQRLHDQLHKLNIDLRMAHHEKIASIKLKITETEHQIHKILYTDERVQELSKTISGAEQRIKELKIKEVYAKKKITALRYAFLGISFLLLGAALTLVSGPLGLVVTLGGIMVLGNQFNKVRKHAEAENAALKKYEFEKNAPALDRLSLVQHQYQYLSKHMKLTIKPSEKSNDLKKETSMFKSLDHTLEVAESHRIQNNHNHEIESPGTEITPPHPHPDEHRH